MPSLKIQDWGIKCKILNEMLKYLMKRRDFNWKTELRKTRTNPNVGDPNFGAAGGSSPTSQSPGDDGEDAAPRQGQLGNRWQLPAGVARPPGWDLGFAEGGRGWQNRSGAFPRSLAVPSASSPRHLGRSRRTGDARRAGWTR